MRLRAKAKAVTAVLLVACAVPVLRAQNPAENEEPDYRHPRTADSQRLGAATEEKVVRQQRHHGQANDPKLSRHDRLSIMAAARRYRRNNASGLLSSERDCSHLVHAIYEQAGLPYSYAPSTEIFAGTAGFERVEKPQPGDLVVWPGHVGIVTKPSHHIFFSFLSSGPGTDDYESPYWKNRGQPRFYRYVK